MLLADAELEVLGNTCCVLSAQFMSPGWIGCNTLYALAVMGIGSRCNL